MANLAWVKDAKGNWSAEAGIYRYTVELGDMMHVTHVYEDGILAFSTVNGNVVSAKYLCQWYHNMYAFLGSV